MSTKKQNQNPDLRAQLREVYKYVHDVFATDATEIAEATGLPRTEVNTLLKKLAWAHLVDSTHVNGERTLTWQTYYDSENETGSWRKAARDFDKAFPKGETVTTAPAKNGATGPVYTDAQLKAGRDARLAGESWKGVAAAAGVKSPVYFSKKVREAYPKQAAKLAAGAAR